MESCASISIVNLCEGPALELFVRIAVKTLCQGFLSGVFAVAGLPIHKLLLGISGVLSWGTSLGILVTDISLAPLSEICV